MSSPDRAAAEDRDAFEQFRLGEIDGVNGDAERFEHHRLQGCHFGRQGHDLGFRNPDLLRHRAVERRGADEFDVRAEVVMLLAAPLAMAARLIGIDRHERAPGEAQFLEILAEIAAELMAGNEGFAYLGAADAAILEIMQIATAETHRGHIKQGLVGLALAKVETGNTRVIRSV
jgi:hypothetical protein